MKKTVAIVCSDITQLGGIERAVCGFSESLIRYGGYGVVIISVNSGGGDPYYKLPTEASVVHLGIKNSANLPARCISYVGMVRKIAQICRELGVDIVIGTHVRLNILLRFTGGKKLIRIACEHNSYNYATPYTSLARRLTYQKLDAVVLLTKNDAAKYGFCKNIRVIPNAAPFFAPRLSDLKRNVVISAGRLEKIKGFDILIKAVSLIKGECAGWKFKIFGEGSERERLLRLIVENRLEDTVEILPASRDIENEYFNSGIYVLPSRMESFGMVLLEAKSCGLPVVSFDCPNGPAGIVRDGVDGVLVENGNVSALAQALLKLIKEPDIREKYGCEAAKDIERFSSKCIFEMWEELLTGLTR
ncbi:MAG: glycosyltransferase family 4 protein [Chitinispirillia bacterium]|nr:glycosyltransferase family 4 protein [Chitinispirillia bacterium]MCL2240988.1 glycosyltransferase family 4 protein [Chitinispirillia bacterium]